MSPSKVDPEVLAGLRRIGLLGPGETPDRMEPLTGGVSSDILLVETHGRRFVVKRALSKLKVAADWRAPVERNAYEVAWMRVAAGIIPDAVPAVLGQDPESGLFAMAYLDPSDHPVWKAELREGRADPAFAAEAGRRLAAIHAGTARRPDIEAAFATDHIFEPIRLEPYLEATARRHPSAKAALTALSRRTLSTKRALVHGDVSPKNILCGPKGPVFLDAECAWYGDPAFDLAFCLNHMLLKCVWTPSAAARFIACFDALSDAYLASVDFEARPEIEGRAATLLPGLFLARVDGKSPVEYITQEADRDRVRATALPLLRQPPARLAEVRNAWATTIGIEPA
jgi:aminoglycoside phosphotransferase (APT) family kinase protein